MNILPLTYLGSTHYFAKLCFSDCVIDLYEHYVKQSYRTRCEILTAGGPAVLPVPVVRPGNYDRTPMKEVRIDYSKRWQHQHWQSLVSAYRNSPYFDFYEEAFAPFYAGRSYDLIADWNLALMRTVLGLLGSDAEIRLSTGYVEPAAGDTDFRSAMSPKPRLRLHDASFVPRPYCQVFSDRLPFTPSLSIVDLLFCEGPASLDLLRGCVV